MKKLLTNERGEGCIGIFTIPVFEAELVPVENGKKFAAENPAWNRIAEGAEGVYENCIRDL